MTKNIPLPVVDELARLRARSHFLSKEEDEMLLQIKQNIMERARIDDEIDRIEKALTVWRCDDNQEPKGFFGWVK